MTPIYEVSLLMLYLATYSFLGWVAEVLFVLVTEQHLENRGFLTGPFLPIYGMGAIALVLFVEPYVENPFFVFVASVVVCSIVEYMGSLLLDKVFHISLWDYRDQRFNLQGRICLRNSLCFGALSLLLIYVLHPAISEGLTALPHDVTVALGWSLIGILIIDSANSFASLAKVRPVLDELHGTLAEAHDRIEKRTVDAEQTAAGKRAARKAASTTTLGRLARAFPQARWAKQSANPSRDNRTDSPPAETDVFPRVPKGKS